MPFDSPLDDTTRVLAATLDAMSGHIAILDESGRIVHVNAAWRRFGQCNGSHDDVACGLGRDYAAVCGMAGSPDAALVAEGVRGVLCGTRTEFRHDYPCHSPTQKRWFQMRVTQLEMGGRRRVVVVHEDITEVKLAAERVWHLAHLDEVTGLSNRRMFLAEATRADLAAVAVISLDCLEAINDTLGQQAGNLVLSMVAGRLVDALAAGDSVGRLQGAEFAVAFAPGQDPRRRVATLLDRLSAPVEVEGRAVIPLGSAGIAARSADDDAETLLRRAALALHQARRSEARWLEHSPEMDLSVGQQLAMDADLRRALADDAFVLHFQPQLDALTGRMIGAEALIRWNRDGRLLPPSVFIPLAEERGLIVPIGDWVIDAACSAIARWRDAGMPLVPIAVNVSPRQFQAPGFRDRLLARLARDRVSPQMIELELTESSLLENGVAMAELVCDLKRDGFRLAVDDFGTGFSSLAYLRRLPLDKLKIDRSFVQDLPGDSDAAAIVRAIIQLSRSLDMTVLAEGVEEPPQVAHLIRASCTAMQGYYFSRPLPEDQFIARLCQ